MTSRTFWYYKLSIFGMVQEPLKAFTFTSYIGMNVLSLNLFGFFKNLNVYRFCVSVVGLLQ